MRRNKMRRQKRILGFALYEVLLGVTIFVIGVLALGRAVQNCMNASELSEEENRVRQLLGNAMSEIQAAPVLPDASKVTKINTGYGIVNLIQKSAPLELTDNQDVSIDGLNRVTLTAEWTSGGVKESKQLVFYVYRNG